ncbi:PKD domain-containing protein [Halovenus sp. HT40]|uniref:PKD domain-containing protein n=1 Tax=Halovenus sp. HT40 TaxID=3126691 RepID=UPI00300E8AC0
MVRPGSDDPVTEFQSARKIDRRDVLKTTASGVLLAGAGMQSTTTSLAQEDTDLSGPSVGDGVFEVYYPDGYRSTAEQALDWALEIHNSLTRSYPSDVDISGETLNILLNRGDVGGRMNWNANPYRIHAQVIENSRMGTVEWREVLAHEYMNIVLNSHSESNTGQWPRSPLWFREGLSDYFVYQETAEEITEQRFPTRFIENRYEEIRNGLGYFEIMIQNNYSGGYLICDYTIDEFGMQPLFNIIAKNGDWESDVENELGVGYDEWRRGWLEWAEENIGGSYNVKVASVRELDELVAEQQERIDELEGSGTQSEPLTFTAEAERLLTGQPIKFEVGVPDDKEATAITWSFGDGETAAEQGVTYAYDESGDYEVEMTATFSDGSQETQTQDLTVTERNANGQSSDGTGSESDSETGPETNSTEDDMPSEEQTNTDATGPGFGTGSALAALGGVGYTIKRRLTTDDSD